MKKVLILLVLLACSSLSFAAADTRVAAGGSGAYANEAKNQSEFQFNLERIVYIDGTVNCFLTVTNTSDHPKKLLIAANYNGASTLEDIKGRRYEASGVSLGGSGFSNRAEDILAPKTTRRVYLIFKNVDPKPSSMTLLIVARTGQPGSNPLFRDVPVLDSLQLMKQSPYNTESIKPEPIVLDDFTFTLDKVVLIDGKVNALLDVTNNSEYKRAFFASANYGGITILEDNFGNIYESNSVKIGGSAISNRAQQDVAPGETVRTSVTFDGIPKNASSVNLSLSAKNLNVRYKESSSIPFVNPIFRNISLLGGASKDKKAQSVTDMKPAAEYPPLPSNRNEALAELKRVFPYQQEFNTGRFWSVCADIGKKSDGPSDVSNQYTPRVVDLYLTLGKEFSPSECLYHYMGLRGFYSDFTTEAGALDIVRFLVKGRHADPNFRSKVEGSFGAEKDLILTKALIYPSVFMFLVENGADIKAKRTVAYTKKSPGWLKSKNWTVLHDISFSPPEKNAEELFNYILKKGVNIDSKTECGLTPLGAAMLNVNIDMMKTLIAKGANVNATIGVNNTDQFKFHGKDICLFSGSLLNVAKMMGNKEIEIILEDSGAKVISPKDSMPAEKDKEKPSKSTKKGK